jgi:CHAT domain-containing protein/tetratricopeptide (TPR) repeat protein
MMRGEHGSHPLRGPHTNGAAPHYALACAFLLAPAWAAPADDARALLVAGRYQEAAATAWNLALAGGPGEADALEVLAEALIRLGRARDPEALESAERAVTLRKGGAEAELAGSLVNLAWVLTGRDERDRAGLLLDRALEIRERLLGPEDPSVAEVLVRQGDLRLKASEHDEAERLIQRALGIRRTADGLLTLSDVAFARNDLARAELLRREAVDMLATAVGTNHPEHARAVHRLSGASLRQGKHDGLRGPLERALPVMEKTFGPDAAPTRGVLNNLALVLTLERDLERARTIHERVIAAAERAEGLDAPDVAMALINLGGVLLQLGEPDLALLTYERNVGIHERNRSSPALLGQAVFNLAHAARVCGRFEESRALYERALALFTEGLGPKHEHVGRVLNDLGQYSLELGDPVAARRYHERSLAIRRAALGEEHRFVAHCIANLGEVSWSEGDLAAARRDLERALAMMERALRADHSDIVYVHNQLGRLLGETGNTASARVHLMKAQAIDPDNMGTRLALAALDDNGGDLAGFRALHEEAIAREEKRFGPRHVNVADLRFGYGRFLEAHGWRVDARRQFAEAAAIRTDTLGPAHPETARARLALAEVRWQLRDAGALSDAIASERVLREHARLVLRSLPERRALGLVAHRPSAVDLTLTIAAAISTSGAVEAAWDAVIRARAMVLDEIAARHADVLRANGGNFARLARELSNARALLAHLSMQGPGEDATGYRKRLEAAARHKEDAERRLAEASASFRSERAVSGAGFDEVARALPAGSALVAYVRFDRRMQSGTTPSYAALVLGHGAGGPRLVALGPASEVEGLVAAWRSEAAVRPPAAIGAAARAEERYRRAATALAAKVWEPVAPFVAGAERVLVVPDGDLQLVNPGSLPDRGGGYLIERNPLLLTLSAERDILRSGPATQGKGLLAVGAPEFDAAALPALPATRDEIREIERLWRSTEGAAEIATLFGGQARESAVRRLAPSRRVIHLATHGYFLQRTERADASRLSGLPGAPEIADSPLLLAGLALSGFGRASANDATEDGILSAEEIASLDLRGVDWVVLSACDTGLGDVRPREGVLGLRRTFRAAGARSLIMTLWAVPDDAARDWMSRLYRARADGLDAASAVRRAAVGSIERRRAAGRTTHPYFWGAFVASGER